ncbi:hypothetical protein [Caldiplasma sukawensis]
MFPTVSPLGIKDSYLLSDYKDQVRVQVSKATMDYELSSIIQPRIAPPYARLKILLNTNDMVQ